MGEFEIVQGMLGRARLYRLPKKSEEIPRRPKGLLGTTNLKGLVTAQLKLRPFKEGAAICTPEGVLHPIRCQLVNFKLTDDLTEFADRHSAFASRACTIMGANMSVATAVSVGPEVQKLPAQGRLYSLDVFRGVTIAAMIVVNNQTTELAFWPLRHAKWNGWTPTDLVFPFFLFIMGVSLVLSFRARLARGETRQTLLVHTLRRSLLLFAIGLGLNALAGLQSGTWRIPGVLQRIALVYCAAALITLFSGTRSQIAWIVALLVGYWIVMRFVPVPGFGMPVRDVPLLHPDANLAAHLDRKLMLGHLWETTRDPEGLLSTFPAVATALCGVLTGKWLCSERTQAEKAVRMFACGLAGIVAGELWGIWFPINKNLWTSSYVLLTSGFALVCLAACFWITDHRRLRGLWTKPWVILGSNALVGYVISELLGGWLSWTDYGFFEAVRHRLPALGSLLYSLVVLMLCFVPLWWMDRKRIFLKV